MSDTPNKQDTPAAPLKTDKPTAAGAEKTQDQPAGQTNNGPDKIQTQPVKSLGQESLQENEPGKDADKGPESSDSATKPTPPKLAPSKPAAAAKPVVAAKPAVAAKKAVPARPKPKAAAAKSSITIDGDDSENRVSMPILVLEGIAAVVAITFTVLIFLDAKPFL